MASFSSLPDSSMPNNDDIIFVQHLLQDLVHNDIPLAASSPLYKLGIWQSNFNPTPDKVIKDKPPILLIHGLMANETQWADLRQYLSGNDELGSIFTINLDGYVTNSPKMGIDDYAKLVSALVKKMCEMTGQKEVLIVGHSMGGVVGSFYTENLAKKDGVMVKALATLSTPWTTPEWTTWFPTFILSLVARVKHLGQMLNKDQFMDILKQQALANKETMYYDFYSTTDPKVPGLSGRLHFHDATRTVEVDDQAHAGILKCYQIWQKLEKVLVENSRKSRIEAKST